MDVRGRRVLVVGAARTGVAVARTLSGRQAQVRLVDARPAAALRDRVNEIPSAVECRLGDDGPAALDGIDLVVPSPGVPATAPVLADAVARGVPVWSEIELAAALLHCPVVAVTGTNGKSTTTTLVGEILGATGARVFVGGNLGTPLMTAVDGDWEIAVAEVSSFQLEWVEAFHPVVAAFLNVTPDHLDRHGSLMAYRDLKARVFATQTATDVAVLNRDDPLVWELRDRLRARVCSFGMTEHAGEGAFVTRDRIVLRGAEGGAAAEFPSRAVRLRGRHNLENVMAAILIARQLGASDDVVAQVLEQFTGLRHRGELVGEVDGVRYYDDSKATNVGAVMKSLEGFTEPVILLAGGLDKDSPFELLNPLVEAHVRQIVAYGKAAARIAAALGGTAPVVCVDRFADAVHEAADVARAGEAVLLAPACASMDQFASYAERGAAFRSLVAALGSPAGAARGERA